MLQLLVPPEAWRHMLRATLRECTYLPDPIAKSYMRQYVLHRYRTKVAVFNAKHQELTQALPTPLSASSVTKRTTSSSTATSIQRQIRLRRSARKLLRLVEHANEGYKRALERVLMLSYGRIGPKQHKLYSALLRDTGGTKQLNTSKDVEELLKNGGLRFSEDWEPPTALIEVLKAQRNSPCVKGDRTTRFKFDHNLNLPKLNSWLKPMPEVRLRNMRRKWYYRAKTSVLPPLDPSEWDVLAGLLRGTEPWIAPVRRKKVPSLLTPPPAELSPLESFLLQGAQKGITFDPYVDERPHQITRRFMVRVWEKIYHRSPLSVETSNGIKYKFPTDRRMPPLTLAVRDEEASCLFEGVDHQGHVPESDTQ